MASNNGMDDEPTECPKCFERSVVFDYLQGLSVCENCGHVLSAEELVSQVTFGEEGRPTGVVIVPGDTGLGASAQLLHGSAVGKAVQYARRKEPLVKLRQHLRLLTDKLGMPPSAAQEADLYMSQLSKILVGTWRRELTAASAAYLAVRQNGLPLTLLDLSNATHLDVFLLGKYFRMAAEILNIELRQAKAADLLPRLLDSVLDGQTVQTEAAPLGADALAMVQWMDHHMVGSRHPITSAGAAIVLALEMNNITVGMDHVASAVHISLETLATKLQAVKEKLLSFSSYLPYSGQVTMKNIGSHAKTIVRLTKFLKTEETNPSNIEALPAPPITRPQRQQLVPAATSPGGGGGTKPIARPSAPSLPSRPDGPGVSSSKKRRRVTFSEEECPGSNAQKDGAGGVETAEMLYVEPDLSDAELDEYLRSPEEVELYTQLYDAR